MMKNTFFNHKIRIEIKVTATTAINNKLKYPILDGNTSIRGRFRGWGVGMSLPFLAITCCFCKLFEELQTVLFKVELIINNAPLTYV